MLPRFRWRRTDGAQEGAHRADFADLAQSSRLSSRAPVASSLCGDWRNTIPKPPHRHRKALKNVLRAPEMPKVQPGARESALHAARRRRCPNTKMPPPDPKALHAALQKYAEASIQKETACLTQELGLQYQVLYTASEAPSRTPSTRLVHQRRRVARRFCIWATASRTG